MLDALVDTIAGAHDPDRHWGLLEALWGQERWFDTPHQRAAAEIARDALADAGLSGVRLAGYPCDGRTRCQDWMMHMAWDCPAGRLSFADTGKVLADRAEVPASVVFWCGPLASSDVPAVGAVVDGDAVETIDPKAVEGRYVLTAKPPQAMKARLVAAGARPLAVVSDYLGEGRGYDENTTKWCNTWSDSPDGWYSHADDAAMTGFCLSPAAGRLLRDRLGGRRKVKLAGSCDARLYDGAGQNVTAVLEGEDPSREVWLYGHACEQGAHDNASGVTVLIEALRMLQGLIVEGALPRPRHSIRAVTTEECVGMAAFATLNDDARRRALAGLNIDAVGNPVPADEPYVLHFGPMSNPSFAWPAAAAVGQLVQAAAGGTWFVGDREFIPTADDMIADPNCGIPSMWLGRGGNSIGYHSSADTPEAACCIESLRWAAVLAAAWAYVMASLDDALAGELMAPAGKWIEANVLREGDGDAGRLGRWAAGRILRDLARWGVSEEVYAASADAHAPAGAAPLDDLPTEGIRYVRTTWGTATWETLPPERREGLSRWSGWITSGLYWMDGSRPLEAVERLARAETGAKPAASLARAVEAALEAGLLVEDNSPKFRKG